MNEEVVLHEYQQNGTCIWCQGTRDSNARKPQCDIRAQFLRASNNPTTKVAAWSVTLDTSIREVLRTMASKEMNYVHFAIGPYSVALTINPVERTEEFKDMVERFQKGQ